MYLSTFCFTTFQCTSSSCDMSLYDAKSHALTIHSNESEANSKCQISVQPGIISQYLRKILRICNHNKFKVQVLSLQIFLWNEIAISSQVLMMVAGSQARQSFWYQQTKNLFYWCNYTYNRRKVQVLPLQVSLPEELSGHKRGHASLDRPRLGDGGQVTRRHQHGSQ